MTLGACKKKDTTPPVGHESALVQSADQVMFRAKFNLSTSGVSTAYLIADTALFFDDNTRIELSRVNATFYTKTGEKDATLTSRTGTYRTNTGVMEAHGDVHVVSEDGRDLRSPELKFDQARNQIWSDSAFVMTEPGKRIEGVGFRSDPNLSHIQVLRLLSGSSSGPMTLPGQ